MFKILLLLFHVHEFFPNYIYLIFVPCVYNALEDQKKGTRILGTGVKDGCEL